jgi:hypothetical protein
MSDTLERTRADVTIQSAHPDGRAITIVRLRDGVVIGQESPHRRKHPMEDTIVVADVDIPAVVKALQSIINENREIESL